MSLRFILLSSSHESEKSSDKTFTTFFLSSRSLPSRERVIAGPAALTVRVWVSPAATETGTVERTEVTPFTRFQSLRILLLTSIVAT